MSIALYATAAAIFLVAVAALLQWQRRRQLHRAVQGALARIYSSLPEKPRLEVTTSYGFPVFNVLFRNHALLTSAADGGLNKAFVHEVSVICEPLGKAARPFNAELAVSFSHENILTRADIEAQ